MVVVKVKLPGAELLLLLGENLPKTEVKKRDNKDGKVEQSGLAR